MSKLPSSGRRDRLRRALAEEDKAVHPDLIARIRRAAPYPPKQSSARRKLEEETRASLAVLMSKKQRPPASVWQRANPRRPHGQ